MWCSLKKLSFCVLKNYTREILEDCMARGKVSTTKRSQMHFHLAHYADALFRSYEERLNSSEWQAAMRLRKHKTNELEALVKRLRSSTKGEKTDCSAKIQELQKQLSMDKEEAEKLQEDRDNFLSTALDEYKRCLVIGDKYDVRVVQSYKFIPLVYQIASRMGSTKEGQGAQNFQFALVSLIKSLAIDHPYLMIFQLLALANGDRIKDKQRSRNSFVVDMDKKVAAENLLKELSSYHGAVIRQMKQMVEIYIKLAELETNREATVKELTNVTSLPKTLISKVNDPGTVSALKDCISLFDDALSQLNQSAELMSVGPGESALTVMKVNNMQTWVSAAMTDQDTCLEGLDEMGSPLLGEVKARVQNAKEYMSNTLAILSNMPSLLQKFGFTMH
ncbi:hypothetical protein K7X08_024561 [Anisodus acutangulus]|uniref:Pectinesterase inhibitor domain-containing protein n=1 Tax=Anisodus acutangulus TaxID=402998 RepID=A0A9Q1RG29_9SOLA|nr:hypothetical protein K7X08_024561 [Anisodus acutangulus]